MGYSADGQLSQVRNTHPPPGARDYVFTRSAWARQDARGRSSSAIAEEEAGEAGETAAEEMRGEDRAEDAEEEIEDRARARRIGEERDVTKDGPQAPDEAHVHQVDREEHVVEPRRHPPRRHHAPHRKHHERNRNSAGPFRFEFTEQRWKDLRTTIQSPLDSS